MVASSLLPPCQLKVSHSGFTLGDKYLYPLSHVMSWPYVCFLRQSFIYLRLSSNLLEAGDDLELLTLLPPPPKCWDWKPVSLYFFFFSQDRVSLCHPGCPGTHSLDQTGLRLRDSSASASWELGLKVCTTPAHCDSALNTIVWWAGDCRELSQPGKLQDLIRVPASRQDGLELRSHTFN